jgi:hypothetical protein
LKARNVAGHVFVVVLIAAKRTLIADCMGSRLAGCRRSRLGRAEWQDWGRESVSRGPKAVIHHIRTRAWKQSIAASNKLELMSNPRPWMPVLCALFSLAPAFGAAQRQPATSDNTNGPTNIESISGRVCKGGSHIQPRGPFGVYVFCDDALGTNIAVFYPALGDPRYEKWTLTCRFWQDGP